MTYFPSPQGRSDCRSVTLSLAKTLSARRPADPELRQRWRDFLRNHREVLAVIEYMGIRRKPITPYSPWQDGAAERWVETVRRDLLDHVIVIDEGHLQRLLLELVAYDHDDRTHLGLSKGTPSMRTATSKPSHDAEIVGHPRPGGVHRRYEWRQAA